MLPGLKSYSVKEVKRVSLRSNISSDQNIVKNDNSTKTLSNVNSKYIQDITPATYSVDFKDLGGGVAFDFGDVKFNQISENETIRKNNLEIIFLVSADGSNHSEMAGKLVTKEFINNINNRKEEDFINKETYDITKIITSNLNKLSSSNSINEGRIAKYLAVYVYFSSKNKDFNYSNSKDTIVSKWCELLGFYKKNGYFYIEDRWSKIHPIEQEMIQVKLNSANFHVVGYTGLKGPRLDTNELIRGLDLLLSNSSVPFIIVKELYERNNNVSIFVSEEVKESTKSKSKKDVNTNPNSYKNKQIFNNKSKKGFNWLFALDNSNLGRLRMIEKLFPLIDKENDILFGLGLYETSMPGVDKVKLDFDDFCIKYDLKNVCYDSISYKNNISDLIIERVNFGEFNFNFVCFYNSIIKYNKERKESDLYNIINKCNSNIVIVNH